MSSERVGSSVSASGEVGGEEGGGAGKVEDSERVGKMMRLLLLGLGAGAVVCFEVPPGVCDVACGEASIATVWAACARLASLACCASRLWRTCSRDSFFIKCGTTLSAPSLSKLGKK